MRFFPPPNWTVTPNAGYVRGPLYPWYSPAVPQLLPTELAEGTVVPRAAWPTGPGAAMEHPPEFGPATAVEVIHRKDGQTYIGPAPLGHLGDGYGATPAEAASFHFVTRTGRAGYTYRLYADGRILWMRGDQRGLLQASSNPNSKYQAILREVGPYTPEAQVASVSNVVSQVVAAFSNQGRQAGLEAARSSAQSHGPAVVEAATEYLSARADNPDVLSRKVARLKAQRSVATDQRLRSRLTYRIRALEQRLRVLQTNSHALAVADDPSVPGDSTRIPAWIPYLAVGIAVASLVMTTANAQKGKK